MCTSKDFPPCQHDELIALVERLQEQVAGLKAANEELQRQLAESQRGESARRLRSRRANEAAIPGVPAASLVRGCSSTASRLLPMKSPSRS